MPLGHFKDPFTELHGRACGPWRAGPGSFRRQMPNAALFSDTPAAGCQRQAIAAIANGQQARAVWPVPSPGRRASVIRRQIERRRSEEHTSELQSLMRISYAVFCLKKKNKNT